jgi:hypothetical protein
METKTTDDLTSKVEVRFTESEDKVAKEVNRDVMEEAVLLVATEKNRMALELRDQGKIAEAKAMLKGNIGWLNDASIRYDSVKLKDYSIKNSASIGNLEGREWEAERKRMRRQQHKNDMQQLW